MFDSTRLIVRLAARNAISRRSNWVIGALLLMGVTVLTVGGSLAQSISAEMDSSIRSTVAGDLQIYSSKSQDPLQFWTLPLNDPRIIEVPDFAKLKETALQDPNVAAVVPMGLAHGGIMRGNALDRALDKLRAALAKGDPVAQADAEGLVKRLVAEVNETVALSRSAAARPLDAPVEAALAQTRQASFWTAFHQDPARYIEMIEDRISPQLTEPDDVIDLQYLGTDLEAFARAFDRFVIVDGTTIPRGQRGFLMSKHQYEDQFKLRVARRLDLIEKGRAGGSTLAEDEELQALVRDNQTQLSELYAQLGPSTEAKFLALLRPELKMPDAKLEPLLQAFFKMDDQNFEQRYAFFYRELAPLLRLYRVKIGDTFVVGSYTRWGYQRAVPVRLYGTFTFRGLEGESVAGSLNLTDLMTFRDLYGFLNEETRTEVEEMKRKIGEMSKMDSATAQAALFGGQDEQPVDGSKIAAIDLDAVIPHGKRTSIEALLAKVYSQKELDHGVVTNAAVLLKDPSRAPETRGRLEQSLSAAGFQVKVIPGAEAAGILGKLVQLAKLFLIVAAGLSLAIVMVVLTNALIIATLQRVKEFGTLRAIGAQLRWIRALSLAEVLLLSGAACVGGVLIGSGLVVWLHRHGIPGSPDASFFFGGPVFHPTLSVAATALALVAVLAACLLSGIYPSIVAGRVAPVTAMQSDE